jgi:hypothetical protein
MNNIGGPLLRPQDIVLACEIAARGDAGWSAASLRDTLGLSTTEVYNALRRCREAGLLGESSNQLLGGRLLELLEHGVRYVYYARLGPPKRGIPTAGSGPFLMELLKGSPGQALVWESPQGTTLGTTVQPLYKTVPAACLRSPGLYEILALVDAIRVGRARERKAAKRRLRELLG